ncbi:MAG: helix-turn-helix domain-containing protein, partial [Muribaculaceae bacterium]|nr:helix-turn-helix domain-containing protein [Muribaculaceae bacterium]
STSHIPVLMLTACALEEQRVSGYNSGADGYLPKPFSTSVLKARCESLIKNRRRIHSLYKSSSHNMAAAESVSQMPAPKAAASPDTSAVSDIDSDFYNRFLTIAERELGNPDVGVDALASEMGLGRSQFYRKIKALTNYSPVELLRHLRLQRARQLLTTTDKSISEIAYETGFTTPAY